ncbi:MAG: hypothetical protein ACI90V_001921, partial [Bacillariaceae sp.]
SSTKKKWLAFIKTFLEKFKKSNTIIIMDNPSTRSMYKYTFHISICDLALLLLLLTSPMIRFLSLSS